jgi:hypothetical protein
MPFSYLTFKTVTEETQHTPAGWDAMDYNKNILRSGLKDKNGFYVGVSCIRDTTPEEVRTYREFIPPFFTFGKVEEYVNGALNIFVRNKEDKPVGVIIFRPLT